MGPLQEWDQPMRDYIEAIRKGEGAGSGPKWGILGGTGLARARGAECRTSMNIHEFLCWLLG